ncbi:MAG: hypothetical protein KL863_12080 [Rhizobium sp.]|nr:hypothetical protein [Rhizobium sp.]
MRKTAALALSYDQLVIDVYEAAANPEYFSELGDRICAFARGGRAHFMLVDALAGHEYVSHLSGEKDDFVREYNDIYLQRDFRVPRVLALPSAEFTDERAYVADEESRSSDIHQDLLARYKVHNIYGANLQTGPAMGWFGISVREAGGEFGDREMRALSSLARHLRQAYATLKANKDLALDRRLLTATLDRPGSAILITDRGRLVHANAGMQQLLAQGFFRLRGERLDCADRNEARKLAALQQDEEGSSRSRVVVRARRTGESFIVTSRYLFPQVDADGRVSGREQVLTVTLMVADGEIEVGMMEAFCHEHGLSPRESDVVFAVLTGGTLADVARARGVTLDTARKQLKAAMARLDVGSQKAMVRIFERFRAAG